MKHVCEKIYDIGANNKVYGSDKGICRITGKESIGLRQEESVARRLTLKTHGMFYRNKSEMIRISPLADWNEKEITAYMFSNELPVLNTYLKHGSKSRTASRIPREDYGIRQSFINDLKQRDFASYQNIIKHFPEITL